MPYADPDKQRAYVTNSRERFNGPPSLEKPEIYYVVRMPDGSVHVYGTPGASDELLVMTYICGPVTFIKAIVAYVKAGGLAHDLCIGENAQL